MSARGQGSLPGAGRGVLVTGCSTGIGRATGFHLADHGFTVFATVRKETDREELERAGMPGLLPVGPFDLRTPGHIPPLVGRIDQELASRGQPGLFAIVNSAGGGSVAPLELLDIEGFRGELETRLVGPVALAQALLPSLRRTGGRMVWIATPALIPIPFVSSIHACDFAANCITRTFALELAPWAIPSVFVRCGGIVTAAPEKNARELAQALARWPKERSSLYEAALARESAQLAAFDRKRSDPRVVADRVLQALCARRPKRVYRCGYMSGAAAVLDLLPQRSGGPDHEPALNVGPVSLLDERRVRCRQPPQVERRGLVDVVVEPVRVQEVRVGAPGHERLPPRVVAGEVVRRDGDRQPLRHVAVVLRLEGEPVVLGVARHEDHAPVPEVAM